MKLYLPEKYQNFPSIAGVSLHYYDVSTGEGLEDADLIIGNPSTVFNNPQDFPKVKFIQLSSAGYDKVPLDALTGQGVLVANARGLYSKQIAEYTLAHILSHVKRLNDYQEAQVKKEWDLSPMPQTLENKKALILGTGSIGMEIARKLKSFDVTVWGINSSGRNVDGFDACYALADIMDQLSDVDYVINALPFNQSTKGIVDKTFLDTMKDTAMLINIGRGDTMNETDLIASLDSLGHVVLDVFTVEPLPKDSVLWTHPKVTITPHISYHGDLNGQKTIDLMHKNVSAFVFGKEIENSINQL